MLVNIELRWLRLENHEFNASMSLPVKVQTAWRPLRGSRELLLLL
jgi:hypothetical protein